MGISGFAKKVYGNFSIIQFNQCVQKLDFFCGNFMCEFDGIRAPIKMLNEFYQALHTMCPYDEYVIYETQV
jgi:hypothetical protein